MTADVANMHLDNISIRSGGVVVRYSVLDFSGGEVQVRLLDQPGVAADIRAHLRSPRDVMTLLLVTDALRRAGAVDLELQLPYLPYARQDRVCAPGEALSVHVIADLINAQKYRRVEVWDAHSDVALALIDRVVNIEPWAFISRIRQIRGDRTVLVSPDAGALKKVAKVAVSHRMPYVRADKSRDAVTGAITGTVVYTEHIGDHDFLIVDDICDGGRTFIDLARVLRNLTDGDVMLYVTHGIFSRGTQVFDGLIDRVFVANSFATNLPDNFHLIP